MPGHAQPAGQQHSPAGNGGGLRACGGGGHPAENGAIDLRADHGEEGGETRVTQASATCTLPAKPVLVQHDQMYNSSMQVVLAWRGRLTSLSSAGTGPGYHSLFSKQHSSCLHLGSRVLQHLPAPDHGMPSIYQKTASSSHIHAHLATFSALHTLCFSWPASASQEA